MGLTIVALGLLAETREECLADEGVSRGMVGVSFTEPLVCLLLTLHCESAC